MNKCVECIQLLILYSFKNNSHVLTYKSNSSKIKKVSRNIKLESVLRLFFQFIKLEHLFTLQSFLAAD